MTKKGTTTDRRLIVSEPEVLHPDAIPEGTAKVEPQFDLLRFGKRFIISDDWDDLIKHIRHAKELEEQPVELNLSMEGFPLDCAVQINKALAIKYGFTHARNRGWFGELPPKRINVKTGVNTSIDIVFGEMAPPAWEEGSLHMVIDKHNPLSLHIVGVLKRKFEKKIREVVELAQELVKTESIYRGNAVELDLEWVEKGNFDPTRCAPKFPDISEEQTLILPNDIQYVIETYLWNVIEDPEIARINKVPLKTGFSFQGKNGTGKSLTVYVTTQKAVMAKWTCLYLMKPLTPKTFITAFRWAQLLGPTVLIVEDCDTLFGSDDPKGPRTPAMNEMLETIDGITAKSAEIISIYTTNYPERLHEAFIRSGGRIDHKIKFENPDADAAGRFVKFKAAEYLHPECDLDKVGVAFAGLTPGDISTGIDIAKINCLGEIRKTDRSRTSAVGEITTEMLVNAGMVMRKKVEPEGDKLTPEAKQLRKIDGAMEALGITGKFNTIMEVVEQQGKEVKAIRERFGINVK